jgi:hypothetical protein
MLFDQSVKLGKKLLIIVMHEFAGDPDFHNVAVIYLSQLY